MMKKIVFLFALTILVLISWLVANRIVEAHQGMINMDFFTFWLGGKMALQQASPYNQDLWLANHELMGADWIPNDRFIYPLPLAVLLIPLGALKLADAARVWLFISILLIFASFYLIFSLEKSLTKLRYLLPGLCALYTFRPVMVTLNNGQLGGLWLFCTALTIRFWSQKRWLLGGIPIAFLLLKPTFGIIVVGLVVIWLIIEKRWLGLLGIGATAFFLAALGCLVDPSWLTKFFEAGGNKMITNFGFFPNIWGFLYFISKMNLPLTIAVSVLIIGVSLIILIRFLLQYQSQLDPAVLTSLILPLSLLFAPYLWAYDQILLMVPILVAVIGFHRMGRSYLLAAALPIAMTLLSLLLLLLAVRLGNDASSALLSVVSLFLALYICDIDASVLQVKRS